MDPSGNEAIAFVLFLWGLGTWVSVNLSIITALEVTSRAIDVGWIEAITDVIIKRDISNALKFLVSVLHKDELEIDVGPYVFSGLVYIAEKFYDTDFEISWIFDFASMIVDAIERDIGGQVDINYIMSSHKMQDALTKKATGQYGK